MMRRRFEIPHREALILSAKRACFSMLPVDIDQLQASRLQTPLHNLRKTLEKLVAEGVVLLALFADAGAI